MWLLAPEEQIVLRYTAALDAKHQKYIQYTNKEHGSVIEKSDSYIIAVNGSKAGDYSSDEIPYIVQAVFPFGLPHAEINWDAPGDPTTGYNHRAEIEKKIGLQCVYKYLSQKRV